MIVCQCNFIREEGLREAVRTGANRLGRAYKALGCKVQCGQCLPFAFEIVAEELTRLKDTAPAACAGAMDPDIVPLRKAG